ncbi:ribonuclease domain-containing protein [Streptomyces showdoensis]|uniref:Guanine-specific ribonuclease N1 and T1 n=1 Tax=Streptomyces showdoensis TaxID=68268 RepID=A0A2P2GQX8_STREW|nr:ribonuclease domain-containing protein [Streptomyces showdoensis]KKZ73896.1 guanine-specific ribonuclease N1 and T1 [Streptomyces showdoensis]
MILRCARLGLALLAGLSLLFLTGCSGGTSAGTSPGTATGTATAAPSRTTAAAPPQSTGTPGAAPTRFSRLPTVQEGALPAEARRTLALIRAGGPFPYAKDGTVFSNFERVLPQHKRGYYHEYTVRTPGERDRGARRIVTGRDGDVYYTDDHYESFREVVADEAR